MSERCTVEAADAAWGSRRRFAACSLAALLPLGCARPAPLRLGFVAELNESAADGARTARNGALLAVEDARTLPALRDRPAELLVRDLGATAADAQRAVDGLAAEGVVALVGPITSAGAVRLLAAATPRGLLVVSPTASSLDLFGRDDLLFRINSTTRDTGEAYARRCVHNGWRRVALAVTTQNRIYSGSWAGEFGGALQRAGGVVVQSLEFDIGASALERAVGQLGALPDIQAVVVVGDPLHVAKLMQALRRGPNRWPVLAAEWAASDELIELGGRAVEGVQTAELFDRHGGTARYVAFRDAYRKRFNEAPSFASVAGYDAAWVALSALARAHDTMPLKDALRRLGPFQGLQQPIGFDAHGDTNRQPYFLVVRNGRFASAP